MQRLKKLQILLQAGLDSRERKHGSDPVRVRDRLHKCVAAKVNVHDNVASKILLQFYESQKLCIHRFFFMIIILGRFCSN